MEVFTYSRLHALHVVHVGEVLQLLEIGWGASFAVEVIQRTGFGEPGKGAPHDDETTCFATHT